MPYKDPKAKRRYMSRHYKEKIKTCEIPSTAYWKGSYGLTGSYANKTRALDSALFSAKNVNSRPITPLHAQPASTRTGHNPAFVSRRERKRPVRTRA